MLTANYGSLSKALTTTEVNLSTNLLFGIQHLKSAVQNMEQDEIDKSVEELRLLIDTSQTLKGNIKRIITQIITLNATLTPIINNKEEVLKNIIDIERSLLSAIDTMESQKDDLAANINIEEDAIVVDTSYINPDLEAHESELCIYTTQELQKWLPISGLTITFLQNAYDSLHSGFISHSNLIDALQALNCPIDIENIYIWIRRLDIETDGCINYVITLYNLANKSSEWWIQFIKEHSIKKVIPKSLFQFIQSSIQEKLNCNFRNEFTDNGIKLLEGYPNSEFNIS